jgi:hypothetical protein
MRASALSSGRASRCQRRLPSCARETQLTGEATARPCGDSSACASPWSRRPGAFPHHLRTVDHAPEARVGDHTSVDPEDVVLSVNGSGRSLTRTRLVRADLLQIREEPLDTSASTLTRAPPELQIDQTRAGQLPYRPAVEDGRLGVLGSGEGPRCDRGAVAAPSAGRRHAFGGGDPRGGWSGKNPRSERGFP